MKKTTIPIAEPFLLQVADLIIKHHNSTESYDFSDVMIVLPGSRSGRRLLEILCEKLAIENALFSPPQFLTPGKFCEFLINFPEIDKIASDVEEIFAWILALENENEALKTLLNKPVVENYNYLPFAIAIRQIYNELAGDLIFFDNVAKITHDNGRETERWLALHEIYKAYFKILESNGIIDKTSAITKALQPTTCSESEAARGKIVESLETFKHTNNIYVVGVVDMFERFRAALNCLSDKITIISHGEKEWFDDEGGLCPDINVKNTDDLSDKVKFCESYSEQSAEIVNFLRGLEKDKYSCRDIVISAPDDDIRRPLKQHLTEAEVPTHDSIGSIFGQTELGILLKSLTDYLNEKTVKTFLNLICHPVIERYIFRSEEEFAIFIKYFQRFASEHILELTDSKMFNEKPEQKEIIVKIENLIAPLCEKSTIKKSVENINELLSEIYNINKNDQPAAYPAIPMFHLEAIKKWRELSDRILSSGIEIKEKSDSTKTIKLMCQLLSGEKLAPIAEKEAVDIIGWLEVPLEDAPIVVLTGMNEGIVPESRLSHVFLPNSLRKSLGIQNDSSRLNRDRYYLRTIVESAEKILITAGKYSANQDPLLPSRLLLDVSEKNQAKLFERFYKPTDKTSETDRIIQTDGFELTGSSELELSLDEEINELAVTRFKDFIECPYRFYLKQKNIYPCKELTKEMPASQFGTVVHNVLEQFGKSKLANSEDPNIIRSKLKELLDKGIERKFGENPHPAVLIQRDSMLKRLNVLAEKQAKRAKNGWKIKETEKEIIIELAEYKIKGKIDRIDEKMTQKCIIDYKTGEVKNVKSEHYNKNTGWINLQLPLYAYWGKKNNNEKIPVTAYFSIQKDTSEIKLLEYEWSEEEIDEAVEEAVNIFKKINSGDKNTFKRTDNMKNCSFCDYKKLCNRDVEINY